MAIAAIELYDPARTHEVLFQMHAVIELNGSGIEVAFPHGRKFRMAGIESVDASRVVWRCAIRAKIRVALRATCIAGCRQTQAAAVFLVARRALRSERLIRVVDGAVVAGLASLVAGLGAESGGLFHVARAALFGENCMTRGHLAAAINAIISGESVPSQPDNRERRNTNGEKEAQAPKGMRVLEVI